MNGKAIVTLLACLLLAACSDPKLAKLPADISKWSEDKGLMEAVGKLDENERKLFGGYAARQVVASAFGGNTIVSDTTLGDALKTQQAWVEAKAVETAKQQALAEQVKQQQLVALKEMNGTLTASLLELKLNPVDYKNKQYSEYFSIEIALHNNTTEALSGIKGTVVLSDMFGEVIKKIGLTNDSQIDPGKTYIYSGTMDYNQFQAADKKLAAADTAKMKFDWEPDTYIFISGKKQTMPK
ncbi:hypothetical protein [Pseudomonas sp. Irchel s3b6]|uniref:hypothetical protein n=1 Tax=Pseudomonas sp. Irchel s3b6 TaxID=2009078 RepID=UPI000BA3C8DE|nr:hypothetical protein [Pseudomonas sp. Irchel s3b6]